LEFITRELFVSCCVSLGEYGSIEINRVLEKEMLVETLKDLGDTLVLCHLCSDPLNE
jgi:hypothetical protein